MSINILTLIATPKVSKGNSESLADYLIEKLNNYGLKNTKIVLKNEIDNQNKLLETVNHADIIILSFPIYENSVPALLLELFEFLYQNIYNITNKKRRFLVISNSGFPEPEACKCAISQCNIFSKEIGFDWIGGVTVSPGVLLDGKKLDEKSCGIYKKITTLLNIIADKIYLNQEIPISVFHMASKPLISPFIYKIVGRIIQLSICKKSGKDKYYAMPLKYNSYIDQR